MLQSVERRWKEKEGDLGGEGTGVCVSQHIVGVEVAAICVNESNS